MWSSTLDFAFHKSKAFAVAIIETPVLVMIPDLS